LGRWVTLVRGQKFSEGGKSARTAGTKFHQDIRSREKNAKEKISPWRNHVRENLATANLERRTFLEPTQITPDIASPFIPRSAIQPILDLATSSQSVFKPAF
jgi:hypothetical protein